MDLKITPSGQTIVKPTALGPGANTDTKLLIYGLFQKGRVLAQDGVADGAVWSYPVSAGFHTNMAFRGQKSEKVASGRQVISVIPSGYIFDAWF